MRCAACPTTAHNYTTAANAPEQVPDQRINPCPLSSRSLTIANNPSRCISPNTAARPARAPSTKAGGAVVSVPSRVSTQHRNWRSACVRISMSKPGHNRRPQQRGVSRGNSMRADKNQEEAQKKAMDRNEMHIGRGLHHFWG